MTTSTILPVPVSTTTDEDLWRASCAGDRDAFGLIVERYQSLVSAIAFSRSGNLAAAADFAQETFVTAWLSARELREPSRLRQWLCGIARNVTANASRRLERRGGVPTALDEIAEPLAPEANPEAQAVSREEEALLWRALADLPETYREPLVLFYREDQSLAEVASQLELSTDAVKQRLSRGRAMLRDEMATMVESALSRSRPTAAFTAGVLAAIASSSPGQAMVALSGPFLDLTGPLGSSAVQMVDEMAELGGSAANVVQSGADALAATGSATVAATTSASGPDPVALSSATASAVAAAGKGLLGSAGAVIVGPATGLFTAWLSGRLAGLTARSAPERRAVQRSFRWAMSFVLPMIAALLGLVYVGLHSFPGSPWYMALVTTGWTATLLGGIFWIDLRGRRDIARVRRETGTEDAAYGAELGRRGLRLAGPKRYATRTQLFGLPLFAFASGGLDVGSPSTRGARGWIAVGDLAVSPLLAVGGLAIAPIAVGGVTVGLLSLSLAGIAVGALAVGSLSFGWWAIGFVAVGWRAAAGIAAIARDYAVGAQALATEANSAIATTWFKEQWFTPVAGLFVATWPILIVLSIVVPLGLMARRAWQLHRAKGPAPTAEPPSR